MNRRTVLGVAGTAAVAGLAGCAATVQQSVESFLQSPVPVEIHSEAEEYHNIYLEAHEVESGRQSYDHGFAVTPGESVIPEHLSPVEQELEILRLDGEQGRDFDDEDFDEEDVVEVESVVITPETQMVLIRIRDDGLDVDVRQRETVPE